MEHLLLTVVGPSNVGVRFRSLGGVVPAAASGLTLKCYNVAKDARQREISIEHYQKTEGGLPTHDVTVRSLGGLVLETASDLYPSTKF